MGAKEETMEAYKQAFGVEGDVASPEELVQKMAEARMASIPKEMQDALGVNSEMLAASMQAMTDALNQMGK